MRNVVGPARALGYAGNRSFGNGVIGNTTDSDSVIWGSSPYSRTKQHNQKYL